MDESIPLTDLPRELARLTGGQVLTYRKAYARVLDGTLPATRNAAGRYEVSRSDLPAIAAAFAPRATSAIAA
jgi:electron transfer flavoprotein alpha/beta subunit